MLILLRFKFFLIRYRIGLCTKPASALVRRTDLQSHREPTNVSESECTSKRSSEIFIKIGSDLRSNTSPSYILLICKPKLKCHLLRAQDTELATEF